MNSNDQAVSSPKSTSHTDVAELAYVESFDAVADKDYAYVIYRETRVDTGKSVIRIKGSATAGATIDPDSGALKGALKKAFNHDEPYLVWGFNLRPTANDPRLVESRILLGDDGVPSALELHLVTRKADRSPRDEQVVTVPWPVDAQ